MKPISTLQLLLAVTAAAAAPAIEERSSSSAALSRNSLVGPKPPFNPLPNTSHRTKVCPVDSYGDGRDDSEHILAALKKCNNGGRAVFDKQYTIGTALNLQFLNHIDLGKMFFYSTPYPEIFVTSSLTTARYNRLHPIHQRHRLLDLQRLPAGLPKRNHIL